MFLVFLAIAVAGAAVVLSLGRFSGGRAVVDGENQDHALVEPVASLPPVLLPVPVEAKDLSHIRFSTALRGYRMDQVDEVLVLLASELERRDQRIMELEQCARIDGPEKDGSDHGSGG
nr:DivIVA domain-containing protein [Arthrobacter roseus]